jgi:hypothetical protein
VRDDVLGQIIEIVGKFARLGRDPAVLESFGERGHVNVGGDVMVAQVPLDDS